jgi:hypothetical protein
MDYAEVGWIRELGKRAVLMMVSMAQVEALREEVEGDLEGDAGDNGDDDDDEDGEIVGEMIVDAEEEGGVAAPTEAGGAEVRAVGGETGSEQPANHPAADDIGDQNGGEADMDIDDGEVTDDEPSAPARNSDIEADIAAAKARLLARLEEAPDTQQAEPSSADADEKNQQNEDGEEENAVADETRTRVNMRATLNMILTVAGEFYGQRDLLEFRDPFPSL